MLEKVVKRLRRKARVRAKISGTAACPRLSVFRSNANIYAQIINDEDSKTLCSASDLKLDKGTKSEKAAKVGEAIANLAKEQKVSKVIFDRNGFAYHGRVKTLADAARKAGLEF
ncbi:MAG: 50S ribosomal protein L18 [Candidatus Gracilibacteria bacterium]|jgi:large subunit ribosomal protein L18|nr:50S ribosomal protein L18 [Candidatus Gracilibacteria bacterium]